MHTYNKTNEDHLISAALAALVFNSLSMALVFNSLSMATVHNLIDKYAPNDKLICAGPSQLQLQMLL